MTPTETVTIRNQLKEIKMPEKPILFCTDMITAILEGKKTQTRRIAKSNKPKYNVGDILWARETLILNYFDDGKPAYKADWKTEKLKGLIQPPKWKPSIFMPRVAARIFLKVTAVRQERLNDISEADAISEGVLLYDGWQTKEYKKVVALAHENGTKPPLGLTPCQRFGILWNRLNAKRGFDWYTNPLVWVYEFERLQLPE